MIWAFGDHELDDDLYQLRRRGRVIPMEPRVFDVLRHLIERSDRVVSKDELLDALWPGEATSDSVLPRCIAAARRALRDDRTRQRLIQTVHGRGYRFVGKAKRRTLEEASALPRPRRARPSPEPLSSGRFIGRTEVLSIVRGALEDARSRVGRVVLLVGEPGIGKTRTTEEVAAEAAASGFCCLSGRCYEGEGAPAFWPWLQVLRRLIGDDGVDATLPELGEANLRDAPGFDGQQLRFRIFDAITRRLATEAETQPLLIALDDLHWADSASLSLLEFVASELSDSPILLLASYRDTDVRSDHPLRTLLGALSREDRCLRVALRGLAHDEVAALIEEVAGRPPAARVIHAIGEMTEGNPFFIRELTELLASEGRVDIEVEGTLSLTLPQGVRDAIGRRLESLSNDCRSLLRAAAVIGRSFETRLLGRVWGSRHPSQPSAIDPDSNEKLLELLAEAEAAHLVEESDEGPGRYAFSHALIRQALYQQLQAPQRTALHRAAGNALAERFSGRSEAPASEIAHHFFEAVPGGGVEEAVEWSIHAAERAHALFAYLESASHYERALEALDFSDVPSPSRRCQLLIEWGTALRTAGRRDDGRLRLAEAAELARSCQRSDLLARAAIGYRGFGEMGAPADAATVSLLEEALAAIGDTQPLLRSQLLSRLTGTPPYSASMSKRQALSQEAWQLAQGEGDAEALCDALGARHWATLGPDAVEARAAVAREAAILAARLDDPRVALMGHEIEIGHSLLVGDRRGLDEALDAYSLKAAALRQPVFQFLSDTMRASRAMNLGRFEEAEELIRVAFESGRGTVPFATLLFAAQVYWLLQQKGETAQVAQAAANFAPGLRGETWGDAALLRILTAFGLSAGSDPTAGREAFEALALEGFGSIERDEHWLLAMNMLADLACRLGDAKRGNQIADLLASYSELIICHDLLRTVAGSVQGVLGQLAQLSGRSDDAVAHYERAVEIEAGLGALPSLHGSQAGLAEALAARGDPGDRERSRDLAAAATAGMDALGGRLRPRFPT